MYHLITYIAITCLWFLFWFIDMYCRTDVLAHYFLFFSSTVIHARSSDEFIIFFRQNTLCWNTIQVSWLIYQIQTRGKGEIMWIYLKKSPAFFKLPSNIQTKLEIYVAFLEYLNLHFALFWTPYQPHLVDVVIECPLYNENTSPFSSLTKLWMIWILLWIMKDFFDEENVQCQNGIVWHENWLCILSFLVK